LAAGFAAGFDLRCGLAAGRFGFALFFGFFFAAIGDILKYGR
jgi:hypothetical protein